MIIIIRFCKNNVLGTIYINFRGGQGAEVTLFTCHFFYYSLKQKNYKSMHESKITRVISTMEICELEQINFFA